MRAVVAPMTPLLFGHLGGLADPVSELRDACLAAVRSAVAGSSRVVVLGPVGGSGAPASYVDPSGARGPLAGRPLAEQVGAHLLDLAGFAGRWEFVPVSEPRVPTGLPASGDVALLVLGEGAARRGQSAPGHLDERSFAFDDALAAALAAGDGAALAALDQDLGEGLMVTGRHTFAVLGELVPECARAELVFRGDPFGVTYFVALWR